MVESQAVEEKETRSTERRSMSDFVGRRDGFLSWDRTLLLNGIVCLEPDGNFCYRGRRSRAVSQV